MRQFAIRIDPPGLRVKQRASSPDLAVRAALHFHGTKWRRAVRRGMGDVICREIPCLATYDRLTFSPGLCHNGQRIYRADPFGMIRAGKKTTTMRRSRGGDDPTGCSIRPAHKIGDLLEASQGGMRSGLIVEIMDLPEWDAANVTPEMAYNDGFTGDEAGAQLMADFIASEGGSMDLYVIRYRPDLSKWPAPCSE